MTQASGGRRRRRAGREAGWNGVDREQKLDGMFSQMTERARNDLGRDDISVGSELDAMTVGLPLPALCLRYLFQSTVYPLGRIMQLTGEEGCCKTGFLLEIMRWHHTYGGGSVYIDNEYKDSPTWRWSIFQWNQAYMRRHEFLRTFYMEEWMDAFTMTMAIARSQQDDPDGPGRTVPICWGLDSIMATAPRSQADKIHKEGHSSLSHPVPARLISDYMRTIPSMIRNHPFSIVGTNHLKPGTDARGLPTRNVPGGKSVKFMETFEIEMKKGPKADIDLEAYQGLRLELLSRKNSLGPSRKRIVAEILWWQMDIGGQLRQCTSWDWDTSTVELLLGFAAVRKSLYNQLMEICPIVVVNQGKRLAHAPALGVGTRAEPALFREIGAALEKRPDLLARIYPLLGITPHMPFQPGVDFRQSIELAQQQAAAEAASLQGTLYEAGPLPTTSEDVLDPAEGFASPEVEGSDEPEPEDESY